MAAKKSKLLEMIQTGHTEVLQFMCSVSESNRNEAGSLEHWSPKDTLAHISAWKQRMANRIAAALDGIPPTERPDYDGLNADIYVRYQFCNWEEIEIVVEKFHQELLTQVSKLSEEDLVDPARFPWRVKHPFWRIIAGNGFLHPLNHLTQAYIQRGLPGEALRLQAQYQIAAGLDDSHNWQGLILYDQSCTDVMLGEKHIALNKLESAMRLYHDLIEWSKQDRDLVSLHNDPDYLAMIAFLENDLHPHDPDH